jgi:hypothetical protein
MCEGDEALEKEKLTSRKSKDQAKACAKVKGESQTCLLLFLPPTVSTSVVLPSRLYLTELTKESLKSCPQTKLEYKKEG